MSGAGAPAPRDASAPIAQAAARALERPAQPLAQFGIEALVAGAARPRPGARAFIDRHGGAVDEVSFADLYQRIGASWKNGAATTDRRSAPSAISATSTSRRKARCSPQRSISCG